MKRKKFGLPVGLVAVLAVIAMGTMGLAYAAWTTSVTINGEVSTGTLQVVADPGTASPSGTATCDWASSDPLTADPNTLQAFTLNLDAFSPNASCTATIELTNAGSLDSSISWDDSVSVSTAPFACVNGTDPGCPASNSWLNGTVACANGGPVTSPHSLTGTNAITCTVTITLHADAPYSTSNQSGVGVDVVFEIELD